MNDAPASAAPKAAAEAALEPIAGPAPAPLPPTETYTAVIHFHGIGQQRHYESVAQLVEGMHEWVWDSYQRGVDFFSKNEFRGLWRLRIKREPLRNKDGTVAAQRVVYLQAEAPPGPYDKGNHRVRFYEAYWAPETVQGTTASSVARWLVKQAWRPLQLLFSRWAEFDRIRIADLAAMHRKMRLTGAPGAQLDQIERIAESYRHFAERRSNGPSSFAAFIARLDDVLKPPATQWHAAFRRKQWLHLAVITLVLGAAVAAFGLLLLAIVWALRLLGDYPQLAAWLPGFAQKIQPTWENALALVPVVLTVLGIKRFLRDHVGDVQQFVSYEETEILYERRRRVLAAAGRQLEHVLCDPACGRVLIVAHSLGTAVAFDALRDLAERNIAYDGEDPFKGPLPLHKIEHFVTLGSPIDKINYFFVTLQSKYRIYETLVRSLRGDIGSTPFSKVGRQPHIHWLNYWDRGDPISGELDSVTNIALGRHDVDNIRVANCSMPHPLVCHTGYHDNPAVIEDLFWIAFYRRYSFVAPARTLTAADIRDWRALVALLHSPPNPAAEYLRSRLSAAIDAGALAPELQPHLLAELNAVIDGPLWFEEARFADVTLRPVTSSLVARTDRTHEDTVYANRLLLEDLSNAISRAPRLACLGPGSGTALQSALIWLQLLIPAALVLALLETLFDWGTVGRWTLIAALVVLLAGSWFEARQKLRWRRLRNRLARKMHRKPKAV